MKLVKGFFTKLVQGCSSILCPLEELFTVLLHIKMKMVGATCQEERRIVVSIGAFILVSKKLPPNEVSNI
jgi:hypothetical protein